MADAGALAAWVRGVLGEDDAAEVGRIAEELTGLHRVLHARQALRWAADAAAELGLGLSIYGEGWEDDAELAAFARGPLGYGVERERLVRDVKINLCVEPTAGVGLPLLDTLVAGGFCLSRGNGGALPRDGGDVV